MDIYIYCNNLHTRTYFNAKVIKENECFFEISFSHNKTEIFYKDNYSYKVV